METKSKAFDAVAESRKWREATSRRLDAMSVEESRRAIDVAVEEGRRAGITGKGLTPFLLAAIQSTTDGRSLDANVALILNNARVGAEIAVALAAVN